MKLQIKKIATHIILLFVAIVQLFPLLWLVLFSLKSNNEIYGGNIIGLPEKFLWSNYHDAIFNGNVSTYLVNSVIVTTLTILLTLFLVVTASYAITRMKWKYSKLVLMLILLGMMVPIHASLLPLFRILNKVGLLNSHLALILPYTAFAIPMGVYICVGFLNNIPRSLEEAACIDGCNIYKILYKIILPLLKPALATVAIFTYLQAWNELMFAVTFINTSKLKTLTVGIMSMAGQYVTEWGPIGAGLVVATLPTVIIYISMSSQVQNSLISGAVKG